MSFEFTRREVSRATRLQLSGLGFKVLGFNLIPKKETRNLCVRAFEADHEIKTSTTASAFMLRRERMNA